jgi:hypothetical protein
VGSTQLLNTILDEKGKFGRILGTFITQNNVNVNEYLIENLLAVRYHGQNKDDVKAEQDENIQMLFERGLIE